MKNASKMGYYSLIHITSKNSYDNIKTSKIIIPSKHTDDKIQWLGDGIYFWDSNDEKAIAKGKNIVRGRIKSSKCVGIIVEVEIDCNKHMNLEMNNWYQSYEKFLKIYFKDCYEKILEYIDIIKNQPNVSKSNLNKLGKVTGKTINFFLDYLFKEEQIDIDMVSGYFFHGKNSGSSFFRREDKTLRQFCIKNANLINNKFDSWKIIENI